MIKNLIIIIVINILYIIINKLHKFINTMLFVRLSKTVLVLLLSAVSPYVQAYYGSGPYGDIGTGVRYDDNVSRAQLDSDKEADFIKSVSGRLGYQAVISQRSLLNLSAEFIYESLHDFKSINNLRAGGTLNYFFQPTPGFSEPWFETTVKISEWRFNSSDIRDSQLLNGSVGLGKRLTDKVIGKALYIYKQRFSEHEVFDTENHGMLIDIDYSLSGKTILYANYSVQFGDVVSTAIPNARIIAAADAVAPDDVFAAGTGPGCANRRCAYRLDATSHQFAAGINYTLNEHFQFDLATQYHRSYADGDNRYYGFIHHANIWFTF